MQPVLSNGTAAVSGMPGHPFDVTRCRPGDRLVARIIDIAPSGRTALSLAGVKAVATQPFGGRAGTLVLLEVLSKSPQTPSPSKADNPSIQPTAGRQATVFEIVVRQNAKTVRLTVCLRAGAGHSPFSDKPPAPPPPNGSYYPSLNMLGIIQTGPPERCLQMAAAWLNALHRSLPNPKVPGAADRTEGHRPAAPTSLVFARQKEVLEAPEAKGAEQPQNTAEACCAAGCRQDGIVRFRLKRGAGRSVKGARQNDLEAVFLLSLERLGAVRTDLRMGRKTISVVFFVESEACRRRFAEALPGLEKDLSRGEGSCRCRVAVSPRKIEALLREPDRFGAGTAFEARV